MSLEISSTTKSYPEQVSYALIAESILGKKYDVSLAFVGTVRARELNQLYRSKNYIPNVLSFELDNTHGEVFITPVVAKKEAHKFNLTYQGYVGYLFIHACLHLKGLDHGDTMDKLEKKYLKQFNLK